MPTEPFRAITWGDNYRWGGGNQTRSGGIAEKREESIKGKGGNPVKTKGAMSQCTNQKRFTESK